MSHDSIEDRQIKCTQNLPFEVIAVPQYDNSRLINSASNKLNEPVNVKIRIRNKDENANKHGIISARKLAANSGRKVRLISSDQTIMSFDFFEDPGTTKKQQKKSHKNIFHIFRPGRCLKTQDNNDDEYHYSPSNFNVINDTKDPSSTMADQKNIISEKIILKKNFSSFTPTNTNTKTTGNFMGKCKPGGCLDPPFNEDKYSYEPANATSNASIENKKDTITREAKIDSFNEINNIQIKTQEISENIIRTKFDNNVYQEDYSHSLITYSSSSMDNFKNHKQGNNIKKRISSENKAKISMNEFSEIYFMPPKKDKTKIKEKISSKNISEKENNTMFEEEKSKNFVASHTHQKSPTLTTDSLISLDNDVIKLESNIESDEKVSFLIEKNLEVKVSSDDQHEFEDIKFSPVAHSSSECIDKNIISQTNSNIALADTEESDILQFVNKKNYSEKGISYNENKADTTVEIKEVDKPILDNNPQMSEKENVEGTLLNEIETSYVRDQNMQNINENHITENVGELVTEIKYDENSLKASQELLKIEHEKETGYMDKIDSTSLKSEKIQNIDKNQNSNNVIPVLKRSEASFKESLELTTQKLREISKTDEIKDPQSKSEDKNYINDINLNNSKHDISLKGSESKSALAKSQENLIKNSVVIVDKNEEKKLFIANTEEANLESSTSTSSTFIGAEETALDHGMSRDLEERYFEKPSEPDGVYDIVSFEKQISIDIVTSQESNYATTNQNIDTKSITDTYKTSYDNKLIISTPPETPTLKTSDVKFSISSLIRDRRDETSRNSFEEGKRDNKTVEAHKDVSLSKSITIIIGAEKNIEIDTNKHFNELNKSKSSLIHISHQITDNDLKENNASRISEVIENIDDKHKISFNTTHDSYVPSLESYETKQVESTGLGTLGNLDENSIRNQPSIDKGKEETYVNSILQPSDESRLDLSTYSSVTVDFGFRCSIDKDNKLMIRSFDTTIPLNEDVKNKVSIIKSIIRLNGDEIRIPITFETDLLMQIKKAEMTSKGLFSSKEIKPQSSDKTINKDLLLQETLNSVYESLIPLNKIIQNLKDEANVLSLQQTSLKEILATMEMKPKRLIHTNPQCGCEKK